MFCPSSCALKPSSMFLFYSRPKGDSAEEEEGTLQNNIIWQNFIPVSPVFHFLFRCCLSLHPLFSCYFTYFPIASISLPCRLWLVSSALLSSTLLPLSSPSIEFKCVLIMRRGISKTCFYPKTFVSSYMESRYRRHLELWRVSFGQLFILHTCYAEILYTEHKCIPSLLKSLCELWVILLLPLTADASSDVLLSKTTHKSGGRIDRDLT